MKLEFLTLINLLNRHLPPDESALLPLKNDINSYVYPVGILPVNLIQKNLNYTNYTYDESIEYLTPFINYLFQEYYSSNELQIITAYLLVHCTYNYVLPVSFMENLKIFLDITSNKPDIKYCLEEIKFYMLQTLVYNKSSNTELIDKLIAQLSSIEKEHNTFNLGLQKTL